MNEDNPKGRSSEELIARVYGRLRQIAGNQMKDEPAGQTLQPTALVHEVFLKFSGTHADDDGAVSRGPEWESDAHFIAAAAQAMRRILIDRARRKSRIKHGGELQRVEMPAELAGPDLTDPTTVLALDAALAELAELDPKKAEIVTLRFFGGLTVPEAAKTMGVSVATAERYWTFSRAWLHNHLAQ